MLLSDVPLCCCCLSLQVVSYHACVCGLFSFLHVIHCVSVLSMPSECCVCVCRAWLNFVFPPLSTVCSLATPRTSTLANKRTHCNLKMLYYKQHAFIYTCIYNMYMYSDSIYMLELNCDNSGIYPTEFCKFTCTYSMHHF